MRQLASIMAALGVLAVLCATAAPAQAGHRYSFGHRQLHDNLQHNSYHRYLTHRSAHRYPMSWQSHGNLHDVLDHSGYHDSLNHRSFHRSTSRFYQPSFGFGFGGYRSGSRYQRSGFGGGFSIHFGH